jgi:hypothetical protein
MRTSPFEEDRDKTTAQKVKYHYYETVETDNSYGGKSKHVKLATATLPIGEFMDIYREKLVYYTYHRGMVRLTTAVRLERMGIAPSDARLIMDYSEKLNKERKTSVQSQHWDATAMTIEVAVAEAWDPELSAPDVAEIAARLLTATGDERGKLLDEARALRKRVYYHCSDYKP